MQLTFRTWLNLTFGLVLLVLLTFAVISYRNTNRLVATHGEVANTYRVLTQIEAVRTAMAKSEGKKLAYRISADERDRQAYRSAADDLERATQALAASESRAAGQADRIRELESAIQAKRAIDARLLDARETDRNPGGASAPGAQSAPDAEIERLLTEIGAEENQRLAARHDESLRMAASTRTTIVIGNLFVLAAVGLAGSALVIERAKKQQAEERIQEQAALLNQVPDAILVRDFDDKILFWNKGAERMYGWTAEEAVGRNADDLIFRDPGSELREARKVVLDDGVWSGEVRQRTRDGRELNIEAHWVLVRDEHERPKAKLVVNTDVTARKKLEAQLLRSQRLESIGILAGGIAHDFNNLLTPIMMAAKLLKEDRPEEERQNLLTTLQAGTERGAEIIKQLLSFAGGLEGSPAELHLSFVIKEIKAILEHTVAKSIRVRAVVAPDLRPVFADATQISQVLMNLSINARDAMPDGGELTIRAENSFLDELRVQSHPEARPGPCVLIRLSDTGTGIPADVIDKIFDPFFTTKQQGKGTGLGLSTALGIVKKCGGIIEVTSEEGRGTAFSIYLPAVEAKIALPSGDEPADLPRGRGETILVVDDEESVRQTVSIALESHGYHALSAAEGSEAIRIYRSHRPAIDALLIDMMMPVMDGPATIETLRHIDPEVRIIATSGLPNAGRTSESGKGVGVEPVFLQKPYSDAQLLRALDEVLHSTKYVP